MPTRFITAAALALASHATAATINVPADTPEIQEAIIIASDGDEIVVAPGNYTENISFMGKKITVRSTDPTNSAVVALTVIDGTLSGSCVTFNSNETSDSILDGLTLAKGSNTAGGGVLVSGGAAPTVRNCVMVDNQATSFGGAVYVFSSNDPLFENCTMMRNEAPVGGAIGVGSTSPVFRDCHVEMNTATTEGGAVQVAGATPLFEGCRFESNTAPIGGVFHVTFNASPTLRDCVLIGNTATDGAGVYSENATCLADRCVFVANAASADGGAVYKVSINQDTYTNCVFSGNVAAGNGGAFYLTFADDANIINCTIEGNTAADGGAIATANSSDVRVANSILWNNTDRAISFPMFNGSSITYSIVEGGFPGEGNSTADPMFTDPSALDYTPLPASPAIDAANNNELPFTYPFDLDGEFRRVDDDATPDTGLGFPPLVDIGAVEFAPTPCPGDCDGDGDVDFNDLVCALFLFGDCP